MTRSRNIRERDEQKQQEVIATTKRKKQQKERREERKRQRSRKVDDVNEGYDQKEKVPTVAHEVYELNQETKGLVLKLNSYWNQLVSLVQDLKSKGVKGGGGRGKKEGGQNGVGT